MMRFRSLFAILMVVLSLGLHVEGPHGHHCILEEAACAACRTVVTPITAATPRIQAAEFVVRVEIASLPAAAPRVRRQPVLVDAPLRAPPSPVEVA